MCVHKFGFDDCKPASMKDYIRANKGSLFDSFHPRRKVPNPSVFRSLQGSAQNCLDHRGETAEIVRFFSLPAIWMGRALLRAAFEAAEELGPEFCSCGTLESRLLRTVLPEIARRLGDERAAPLCGEARYWDDFELRHAAISTLCRAPLDHESKTWRYLARNLKEGNPIAIALDRACPPCLDSDWSAAQLRSLWTGRGVDRMTWGPELLELPAA